MKVVEIGKITELSEIYELYSSPRGRAAYGRACLIFAIRALSYWIERSALKRKLVPNVELLVPCPALFNSYYKSGKSITIDKDMPIEIISKNGFKGMLSYAEERGFVKYGDLEISDAMADTVLFLSNTRRLYCHYIGAPCRNGESSKHPNVQSVLSELSDLFKFWDKWRPKSRLDLSKSKDIPPVSNDATIESLSDIVPKHDPGLLMLLFLLFAMNMDTS